MKYTYNEVNINLNHKYHNILTILWFGLRHIEGLRWTNIYKLYLNSIETNDKQVSHQYGSVTSAADNSEATAVSWSKGVRSANSDCAFAKQTITKMRARQDNPDKTCTHYIIEIIQTCFKGFKISPTKSKHKTTYHAWLSDLIKHTTMEILITVILLSESLVDPIGTRQKY